jgi:hypothetical protein
MLLTSNVQKTTTDLSKQVHATIAAILAFNPMDEIPYRFLSARSAFLAVPAANGGQNSSNSWPVQVAADRLPFVHVMFGMENVGVFQRLS